MAIYWTMFPFMLTSAFLHLFLFCFFFFVFYVFYFLPVNSTIYAMCDCVCMRLCVYACLRCVNNIKMEIGYTDMEQNGASGMVLFSISLWIVFNFYSKKVNEKGRWFVRVSFVHLVSYFFFLFSLRFL